MKDIPDTRTMLTRRQAAAYLQEKYGCAAIAINTLAGYAHRGIGPVFYKVGGKRVFYTREDLDRWMRERIPDLPRSWGDTDVFSNVTETGRAKMATLSPDQVQELLSLRELADEIAKRLRAEGLEAEAKIIEQGRDGYDSLILDSLNTGPDTHDQ